MRGRTRFIILFVSAAILVPQSALSYTIVRKDGTKFEAQAAPEYKDGKAIFLLAGGSKGSMAEADVNKAATEKANAAPAGDAKKGKDQGKGVVTNENLAASPKSMPKGGGKSSFTNEDLAKAEGKATVEGSVDTAQPGEAAPADGADDWAKRHDEEMARIAEQRKKATEGGDDAEKDAQQRDNDAADKAKKDAEGASGEGEKDAGGAPPKDAAKAEPPKDETPEEKTARLEKERDELREKLVSIDNKIGGGAGDAATVNERLQTAEDLNKAEEALEDSKDGDEE